MRKGYFVSFAVLLGLLMPCDEACAIRYAKKEYIDQEVVSPLLQYQGAPICWNYEGTLSGDPYFNVSLDKVAKDQEGLQYAQAGCVNTSMGTIMYANAYPSASALPGEALDTNTEFRISIGNLFNRKYKSIKMKGGFYCANICHVSLIFRSFLQSWTKANKCAFILFGNLKDFGKN